MSQFDVYYNEFPRTLSEIPFVVDVQSELLSELATRVVVPLENIPPNHSPIGRLNPIFEIQGRRLILLPTEITSVPSKVLGPLVTNLGDQRDRIISAIDFALYGR